MEEAIVGCRESKGRKKIIRFPKDSIASTSHPATVSFPWLDGRSDGRNTTQTLAIVKDWIAVSV